ncbi:MAG TPA: hypothetical protein VLJ10_00730 [Candidatus Bathyarchaeia archaeon]|nr:hypothetical protein [Candidatus Bathyarchaeia archaeon]
MNSDQVQPETRSSRINVDASDLRIVLAGTAALYVELAVIRYIPGQIRILGYFTNFVLFAAFLGYGLGMLAFRRWNKKWVGHLAPATLLALVCLTELGAFFNVIPSIVQDVIFLTYQSNHQFVTLAPFLIVSFIFLSISFLPLGYFVGQTLHGNRPLRRYSLNLVGSILGSLLFMCVTALVLPAWVWMLLAGLMSCVTLSGSGKGWKITASCAVVVLALVVGHATRDSIWSPYHKITMEQASIHSRLGFIHEWQLRYLKESDRLNVFSLSQEEGFTLRVNDSSYQTPLALNDAAIEKHPGLRAIRLQFDLPFLIKKKLMDENLSEKQKAFQRQTTGRSIVENRDLKIKNVLILGSGTGNDVAAALRFGVENIDAVEIDPQIFKIGQMKHPERPYQNPRVKIYIDDARSFLSRNKKTYDMIVFGLLDSHILASQKTNIRLDSYVFTRESFQSVKERLNPDGILVLSHAVGKDFFSRRMSATLSAVFGKPPLIASDLMRHPIGVTYITGEQIRAGKTLPVDNDPLVLEDDWPFLYLHGRRIPRDYLWTMFLIAVIAILSVRLITGRNWTGTDFHFFALGCGFMLIETRAISIFMLLAGSTWIVNSAIFAGILLMNLLSALLIMYFEKKGFSLKVEGCYILLAVFLVLNFFVQTSTFLGMSFYWRILAGALFLSLPFFASGIIFSINFSRVGQANRALASNLIGALFGGLLEYVSMVAGFRFLLIPAALVYLFAFLSGRKLRNN